MTNFLDKDQNTFGQFYLVVARKCSSLLRFQTITTLNWPKIAAYALSSTNTRIFLNERTNKQLANLQVALGCAYHSSLLPYLVFLKIPTCLIYNSTVMHPSAFTPYWTEFWSFDQFISFSHKYCNCYVDNYDALGVIRLLASMVKVKYSRA